MDWMNQLSGILQQYSGAQPTQAPDTVHDDFDQFAQNAPQSALADGLAAAFRSNQTPAFGQMVSQLFSNAGGQLKLLNLTQKLKDLLGITKLLTVFDTYTDEAEALGSYN